MRGRLRVILLLTRMGVRCEVARYGRWECDVGRARLSLDDHFAQVAAVCGLSPQGWSISPTRQRRHQAKQRLRSVKSRPWGLPCGCRVSLANARPQNRILRILYVNTVSGWKIATTASGWDHPAQHYPYEGIDADPDRAWRAGDRVLSGPLLDGLGSPVAGASLVPAAGNRWDWRGPPNEQDQ